MGRPIPLKFKTSLQGVNNLKEAWELTPDELVYGTNIDISNTGRRKRRQGFTSFIAGEFDSLYSTPQVCLAVKDKKDLVVVNPDATVTTIRENVGSNPMSYTPINDRVAYTNSTVIGYVKNGTSYLFPDPTDNFKLPLPVGQLIEEHDNRLYIASGNVIWWSDVLSKRDGCIDKRRNGRQLPSRVILMKAVEDGLYLSDENAMYFAAGLDPFELTLRQVLDYPAIFNMACRIDGNYLAEPVTGTVLAIGTREGICIAMAGGIIRNVTQTGYRMLNGQKGAMLYRDGDNLNQIISAIDF